MVCALNFRAGVCMPIRTGKQLNWNWLIVSGVSRVVDGGWGMKGVTEEPRASGWGVADGAAVARREFVDESDVVSVPCSMSAFDTCKCWSYRLWQTFPVHPGPLWYNSTPLQSATGKSGNPWISIWEPNSWASERATSSRLASRAALVG